MAKAVLVPALLLASALAGCVSETVHLSQGRQTGEVVFEPSQAALTRMNLGLEYLRRGDTGQAKFNLERALSQDVGNPDIHLALAYFFQTVSEYDKAEQHYRQMLRLDPQHGDGLNNYGAFLCDRERFDEADVMFRKAIAVFGYAKVADTLENAALCALDGGRDEAALDYFRRALEYSPGKPRALLGMAGLELERGDPVFAQLYLDRYRQRHSPTAQSLWLTVRTARARGLGSQAQQAGAELVRLFPDSEQAERLLTHDN
ncbi:type IV pilus biogenesis/stability protein PilW [Oceanimonas sp. CHS3-5]|uniref:type IV pilus biogenesis/stability protein PilW n=1 Tax=Oceanimonas sp. CHS3-5 TaxID=3068186 RepID=UPI0027402A5F|nr:type IV pilus biogenesis/stability protein PilW [Oceanimonas sp. CHS3-5]MDP5292751.1 type IV pilus biogenesis/stability protein PilW [Oceanimonas sp. CHS3-5]